MPPSTKLIRLLVSGVNVKTIIWEIAGKRKEKFDNFTPKTVVCGKSFDLAGVPSEWLTEFRQAAMRGKDGAVLAFIEQIEDDFPDVATGLKRLL
jgi:hypothetical protein